jgi:hypothetical protein
LTLTKNSFELPIFPSQGEQEHTDHGEQEHLGRIIFEEKLRCLGQPGFREISLRENDQSEIYMNVSLDVYLTNYFTNILVCEGKLVKVLFT